MAAYSLCDDTAFIKNNNIFEWTPGEKRFHQQQTKTGFQAVLDLLDRLGYYGVRVKGKGSVDPFEIIVGGLSWCIGYIKPEYTYDIAFTEGMSLGKKIALSERIIDYLRAMNYPGTILPQQIQGMDFHAIESVFEWLYNQITEIRNSLPHYESLAALQEFDDSFVFDKVDSPPSIYCSLWKSPIAENTCEYPPCSVFPSDCKLSRCDPSTIFSFQQYLRESDSSQFTTFNEFPMDDFSLSDPVTVSTSIESTSIRQLLHVRDQQMGLILQAKETVKQKEQEIAALSDSLNAYQMMHKQTELRIQNLIQQEINKETAAKLQELKSMTKLLESLHLQYSKNHQLYGEEMDCLMKQLEIRKNVVSHEKGQFELIEGIHHKVHSSLSQLLAIYRSIHVDILKCQCFLERIPSTPELIFFESEMIQFMDSIVEKSLELSQCYDIKNNLHYIHDAMIAQLGLLNSLINSLKNKRFVMNHKTELDEKLKTVVQQLSQLVQQYNGELKKKTRVLKTMRANHANVMEKVRKQSQLMQTFRTECEQNKELTKRIRELQSRRNHFVYSIC